MGLKQTGIQGYKVLPYLAGTVVHEHKAPETENILQKNITEPFQHEWA